MEPPTPYGAHVIAAADALAEANAALATAASQALPHVVDADRRGGLRAALSLRMDAHEALLAAIAAPLDLEQHAGEHGGEGDGAVVHVCNATAL